MEIRAIYEKGVLKPIDHLELEEGQEVKLTVLPNTKADFEKKLAEAGVLAVLPEPEEEVEISDEELERIGTLLASDKPVEELIDEDRGEY
jgi:predicted DNA-binding antitoxin AbrB/MazE fold protein